MARYTTPESLLADAWAGLQDALHRSDHPFRTPVLGTVGSSGLPQVRTIVLRRVDAESGSLRFYSDSRAEKIKTLANRKDLAWLFWDPSAKLQIRARGEGRLLHPDAADEIWDDFSKTQRRDYAAEAAPGTASPTDATGLPEDWEDRELAETDYARLYFRAVDCQLTELDLLYLDRSGHQRAQFSRSLDDGSWQGTWVIP